MGLSVDSSPRISPQWSASAGGTAHNVAVHFDLRRLVPCVPHIHRVTPAVICEEDSVVGGGENGELWVQFSKIIYDNLGERIGNAGVRVQGYISPFRLRMGSWRRKPTANNDKGGEYYAEACGQP